MKKQYHNYMRDQKNKLRQRLDGQERALQKKIESKVKYEENYGKYPELFELGELDRIGGHNPQIIDDKDMKKSYEYGFFKKGSKTLAGEFARDKHSIEEQRQFGIRDLNNGVKNEELFNLTDYPNYMNGRIYQMGRNIYKYIEENNLEIDEYISVMSIIYPNIANPEFKIGYYEQKEEIEEKNKKIR